MKFIILCTIIIIFLYILIVNLGKFTTFNKNKINTFECGIDPYITPRMPFSIRFFKITILFLIFDIEIVLLLPIIIIKNRTINLIFISFSIIFLILLGLLFE